MLSSLQISYQLLLKHKLFILQFVVLFSIGLGLFATTQNLSNQVIQELNNKNREILEGDVRLTLRRAWAPDEKEILQKHLGPPQMEVWSFFSMVGYRNQSKLVQVKAVPTNYPLIEGAFLDSLQQKLPSLSANSIYIPVDMAQQLALSLGDSLQLGNSFFTISGIYQSAPDSYLDFSRMMFRTYIPFADMQATGLEKKGSRIFRSHHYLFPNIPEENFQTKLSDLKDPEIKMEHSGQKETQISSRIDMILSFLRLITLLTFLLTALGAIQFFKSHLQRESQNQGILLSLGCTPTKVLLLYFYQVFILSCFTLLGSYLISSGLHSISAPFVLEHFSFVISFDGFPWFSLLGTLLITLSIGIGVDLFSMSKAPINSLLKQQQYSISRKITFAFEAILFPIWCFCLAYIQSNSYVLSLSFVGIFYLALWGSLPILYAMWAFLKKAPLTFWKIQFFFAQLKNQGSRGIFAFSTLVFIVMIINLLPQIQFIIESELRPSNAKELPRWFLIDIQEDDLEHLETKLTAFQFSTEAASPMIRARLQDVNGNSFQAQRDENANVEAKQQQRWRNRGYNLSYKETLSKHEEIIAGEAWNGVWDGEGLPSLSLEKRFADRIQVQIGDTLTFLVEGIEIAGVVKNLRRVKWASFSPNFFVLFQTGVLEDAPKTFILSLPELGNPSQLQGFRETLQSHFPMISLIDLREIVNKSLKEFDRWVFVMQALSILALFCGLLIFVVVLTGLLKDSRKEWLLLETLGYTPQKLFQLVAINQIVFLGFAAGLGMLFSLLSSWGINFFLWSLPWVFPWYSVGYTVLAVCVLSFAATLYGYRTLQKGSLRVLLRG